MAALAMPFADGCFGCLLRTVVLAMVWWCFGNAVVPMAALVLWR
jgi:hypothetical protein